MAVTHAALSSSGDASEPAFCSVSATFCINYHGRITGQREETHGKSLLRQFRGPLAHPGEKRSPSSATARKATRTRSICATAACNVRVGLPEGSASRAKAEKDGLTVNTPAEAAAWADVIMILAPDTKQPKLYTKPSSPISDPARL